MDPKKTTLADFMTNVGGTRPLRECFNEYFLNHSLGLPPNSNECETEVTRGLDAFFTSASQPYSPPQDCAPGQFVAKVMGVARFSSLREALKHATLHTGLNDLPSDNHECRRVVQQAIDTYKILQ